MCISLIASVLIDANGFCSIHLAFLMTLTDYFNGTLKQATEQSI